jgi:hypothetical protein
MELVVVVASGTWLAALGYHAEYGHRDRASIDFAEPSNLDEALPQKNPVLTTAALGVVCRLLCG